MSSPNPDLPARAHGRPTEPLHLAVRTTSPRLLWLAAILGALVLSLLIATQNYYALERVGRTTPWWVLFRGEIPVWLAWLSMAPAIGLLLRRFSPIERPVVRNLAVHIVAALVSGFLVSVLATLGRVVVAPSLIPPEMSVWTAMRVGYANTVVVFLLVYGVIATGIMVHRFNRDAQRRRLRESQLMAALTQSRLDSLRSQLQPHFLFNTLHAISALMAEDVAGARQMMRRLSELLRLSLEDGPDTVPLRDEIHFVRQYLEIQKIRFGDMLHVDYEIDADAMSVEVPRLLIQPIVENAIKHGGSGDDSPTRVTLAARMERDELAITVADNGQGFASPDDVPPLGVGLRNTESRLEQIYGGAARLRFHNGPAGGAVVEVTLPIARNPNRLHSNDV